MEILEIAQNSGLHDYTVEDITVDYKAGQIKLHLLTPALKPCKIKIDRFSEFSIQNEAPWGEGCYIAWSDVQPVDKNIYHLEIGLNSGDEIHIAFFSP